MNPSTLKHARTFTSLVAAGALLALPAIGQANHNPGHSKGKPAKSAKPCAQKTYNVGFSVGGTLVSATADNPATPGSEASVTLKVTSANSHARKSGDLKDMDLVKKGVQAKGSEFTVAAGDAYILNLDGYEGTETPAVGDKVKVNGKIAVTKKRCAPAGTSTADRYGAADVRKVTISDRKPDVA